MIICFLKVTTDIEFTQAYPCIFCIKFAIVMKKQRPLVDTDSVYIEMVDF